MRYILAILALALLVSVADAQVAVRTEKASGQKINLSPTSAVNADSATSVAFVDYLVVYKTDPSDQVLITMKNGSTIDTLINNTQPATPLETQFWLPIGVKVSTSDTLIVTKSAQTTGLIVVYRTGY